MPLGLYLCLLVVAAPDDLAAARTYICAEFAAHVKEIQHPVNGKFSRFLERNCVAGYRFINTRDFQSYETQVQAQKVTEYEKDFSKVEMRLVDLKKVEGGYGVVVYQTRTTQTPHGPSARREIEYQFWINTRKGLRLKAAMIRHRHIQAKDYHLTFEPEFLRTIWKGPQPVISAALMKELHAPN